MSMHIGIVRTGAAIASIGIAVMGAWHLQATDHAAAQSAAQSLSGTYMRDASAAAREDAARATAIAAGTEELTSEERRKWTILLTEIARPANRIVLGSSGSDLVVDNGAEVRSAASGATREVADGIELKQQVEDGVLVQRVESERLGGLVLEESLEQTLTYTLSNEGRTLTVATHIEGGELTEEVVLTATYLRR